MEGNISLAWAIEVDQAQLGARLEAYVSTKAAITTLRSCLARYLLPPSVHIQNRNIPQEVIDLIADAVKDAVYIPKVQDWTRSQKCVQAKCLVLDHFKPGEFYGSLASDYAHPRNVGNGWIEEAADGRCYQVLSRYLRKITPGGGEAEVRKFALCKDIFESEFHIRPYYTVLRSTYNDQALIENAYPVRVSAYLALPVVDVPIESEPGIEKAWYTVQQKIDTAAISHGPSVQVQQLFKKAVKALRLETGHTNVQKVVPEAEDRDSMSSSSSESESDVDMTSTAPDCAESKETADGDEEDLEENEGDPEDWDAISQDSSVSFDSWGRYGKYRRHCIDCGDRICQGRYQAPEPALIMLASGEMEAYSAEE